MPTQAQIDAQDALAIVAQPSFKAVFTTPAGLAGWDGNVNHLPPSFEVGDALAIQAQIAQGNVLARGIGGNLLIFTTSTNTFFSVLPKVIPGTYGGPPATPPPTQTAPPPPPPAPNQPPIPGEGGGPNTGGTPAKPATGTTLTPLPPVSLPPITTGQSFSTTVANALGTLGTPADGWDALFAVPASAIDADASTLGELDTAIAAADFAEGVLDASSIAPLQPLIDSLIAEGNGIF